MNPIVRILAVGVLALSAGCSLAPTYERPSVDVREEGWAAAAERSTAEPAGVGAAPGWWREFGSPELDALVREAQAANPTAAAAAARVQEARAAYGGQRWNRLPSAEVGGTVTRSQRNLSGFGIPRSVLNTQWDVAASAAWELDLWGRLSDTKKSAWSNLLAGEAEQRAVRQALTADVVRAWLNVKLLRGQRDLGRRTLDTYRASERMVIDRYEAGVRPASEVHLARQNVAAAEAALAQTEQDLAASRRALELLLGRYPAGAVGVGAASLAELPQPPAVPAGLPSDLLERRPDVAAAELRLVGATARVGAARAELFPRLSLSGSAGWSTPDEAALFTEPAHVWSLLGNLALPLLNRGARKAQAGVADAQREQAAAAYVQTVLGAFRDVESALDADHRQAERLEALRRSVTHARRSAEVIDERYRRGLDTYLQVLDSQRRLLVAEGDLLRTEGARRAARVNLIQALGGHWDDPAAASDPRGASASADSEPRGALASANSEGTER